MPVIMSARRRLGDHVEHIFGRVVGLLASLVRVTGKPFDHVRAIVAEIAKAIHARTHRSISFHDLSDSTNHAQYGFPSSTKQQQTIEFVDQFSV